MTWFLRSCHQQITKSTCRLFYGRGSHSRPKCFVEVFRDPRGTGLGFDHLGATHRWWLPHRWSDVSDFYWATCIFFLRCLEDFLDVLGSLEDFWKIRCVWAGISKKSRWSWWKSCGKRTILSSVLEAPSCFSRENRVITVQALQMWSGAENEMRSRMKPCCAPQIWSRPQVDQNIYSLRHSAGPLAYCRFVGCRRLLWAKCRCVKAGLV